jgi:hypothetical protein
MVKMFEIIFDDRLSHTHNLDISHQAVGCGCV